MSFLWNPYVMLTAAVLLSGGLFWAYMKAGMNGLAGERISYKERFWIRIVVVTFGISMAIAIWRGYGQLTAISTAVYLVATGLFIGCIIAAIIFFISFRKSRMEEAYREYDELAKVGNRPCIILSSVFGPKVIANYPSTMRTGLLMWSEGGKLRCYQTTTQERLDGALGVR